MSRGIEPSVQQKQRKEIPSLMPNHGRSLKIVRASHLAQKTLIDQGDPSVLSQGHIVMLNKAFNRR